MRGFCRGVIAVVLNAGLVDCYNMAEVTIWTGAPTEISPLIVTSLALKLSIPTISKVDPNMAIYAPSQHSNVVVNDKLSNFQRIIVEQNLLNLQNTNLRSR